MTKRKSLVAFGVVLAVLVPAPVAHAQAARTWVSGVGDDANPCSRTAPCKTYAGAISKTAAGGEISALDPGGYGAVTITKSITIDGRGTIASVLNASTNGIVVNAGANDIVTLRNIDIQGIGTGIQGIRFLAGKTLHLRNVDVRGQTNAGIYVSSPGRLTVDRSYVADSTYGLFLSGLAKATITNTEFAGNTDGIVISGGSLTARNVVVTGSAYVGVYATAGARVTMRGATVTAGHIGLLADGGTIRASDVTVTDNDIGLYAANGGQILSRLDNTVADNTTNGSFTGSFGGT